MCKWYGWAKIGGILDTTLDDLKSIMEEVWEYSPLMVPEEKDRFLMLSLQTEGLEWEALTQTGRTVMLILFCRSFGRLISIGVPVQLALEAVAELLPPRQCELVRAAAHATDELERKAKYADFDFLTPLISYLLLLGQEVGDLNILMERGAFYYRNSLLFELGAVGSVPVPRRDMTGSMTASNADPEVVKQFEQSLKMSNLALDLDIAAAEKEAEFFNEALRAAGADVRGFESDRAVVTLVGQILDLAFKLRAQEIALSADARLTFRVADEQREIRQLPIGFRDPISARLLMFCDLDPIEQFRPQAGTCKRWLRDGVCYIFAYSFQLAVQMQIRYETVA